MLTAYQHDEGSIRQLAQRFKVRPRFVGQLVVGLRRTGRCAPQLPGGGHPPGIARSPYATLSGLVQAHPDAPRKALCRLCEDSEHVVASTSSRQRTLATLRLTRKKRRALRQHALPRRSKRNAVSLTPA